MPLFKQKLGTCPICDAGVPRGNFMFHNAEHALPAPDGKGGFIWICVCGETDGVWDDTIKTAAGLTVHMRNRHGLIDL